MVDVRFQQYEHVDSRFHLESHVLNPEMPKDINTSEVIGALMAGVLLTVLLVDIARVPEPLLPILFWEFLIRISIV